MQSTSAFFLLKTSLLLKLSLLFYVCDSLFNLHLTSSFPEHQAGFFIILRKYMRYYYSSPERRIPLKKNEHFSLSSISSKKKFWAGAAIFTLVIFIISTFAFSLIYAPPIPQSNSSKSSSNQPPAPSKPANIVTPDLKKAVIETEQGKIVIALFTKEAPLTTQNFEKLIRAGFYNGVTFHRIIKDFVAQGGDPQGDGTGGPGYSIPDELAGNPNRHIRGALSMAHRGPNTGGSQFFIVYQPQPHLDGVHTVFGQVVEGMNVVDKLKQGDKMIKVYMRE
jgi:peptidyl-prolyl cis-trans isomerase B (cyclophilin B)